MKSMLDFPCLFLLFGKDISVLAVFADKLCVRQISTYPKVLLNRWRWRILSSAQRGLLCNKTCETTPGHFSGALS